MDQVKKKQFGVAAKEKAVGFLRQWRRTLQEVAWGLYLKISTIGEWDRNFDEKTRPLSVPDGRGKEAKITADIVRQVVKVAKDKKAKGERVRLEVVTKQLRAEHNIGLSRRKVTEILIANDLYKASTRKRRPRFYQSLKQSIPNGLLSVDGSEFDVFLGEDRYKFNVELGVDVNSYYHSAYSVSDSETTEEVLGVLETHKASQGNPLAMVADHGKANLSGEAKEYLERNSIEILPVGPANPKGNGTDESAFSGMKRVIGTIRLDTTSSRALAKSVLEKVVGVYVAMRNRLPRYGETTTPEEAIKTFVPESERQQHLERYRKRKQKKDDPNRQTRLNRLDWIVSHHNLEVDEHSLKRGHRCIVAYDLKAIAKSEEAFLKAIRRDQRRRTLPYFFGILNRVQEEMDAAARYDYCRKRYNYQHLCEKKSRREKETDEVTTVESLAVMLREAVTTNVRWIKELCIRQAERNLKNLKKQYSYMGALKRKLADALGEYTELSLPQRKEAFKIAEQFLN